ncbi:flagellar export chaperone FlgN [Spirochaeta africana]|uniref:Small-conductance mechanosensitive channel n=1 Tax=Spirochaeta africana (strain ATCC 700263 / DSM 8902 / Z-7692) TaxID=889378 RepID=H9UMJ9_SPIAZ|nr:flagellar export chaperone FlgN [Spirochaeta africana]AFG38742.1 small-conductance mechanosensitive channel [Spirochaeta africana DSM 8902]
MYSEHEITQREAVLRKLRRMLERQRERFQDYLHVLDTQQSAIAQDNLDALEQQVELETSVLEQIVQTQKTIAPLEQMYQQLNGGTAFPADIAAMQTNLTEMRSRISAHNADNRARLSRQIEQMRHKVAQLRIPNRHTSPYAAAGGGSMVDIQG